jgi:glycosidase
VQLGADVEELLTGVHRRGLGLVTGLVVNHTSDRHAWFVESRKSGDSPCRDYQIRWPGRDGQEPKKLGIVLHRRGLAARSGHRRSTTAGDIRGGVGDDPRQEPRQRPHADAAGRRLNTRFATGTPWIKVNPDYTSINVQQDPADADLKLHYCQALIRLRKSGVSRCGCSSPAFIGSPGTKTFAPALRWWHGLAQSGGDTAWPVERKPATGPAWNGLRHRALRRPRCGA